LNAGNYLCANTLDVRCLDSYGYLPDFSLEISDDGMSWTSIYQYISEAQIAAHTAQLNEIYKARYWALKFEIDNDSFQGANPSQWIGFENLRLFLE